MSQLDDRMRGAAAGLSRATATSSPPAMEEEVRAPRRRALTALVAAAATVAVVLATLLVTQLGSSSPARPAAPPRPSTGTLPPLLPSGLKLPAHWFLASAGATTAVLRGTGPVHRIVVWRPSSVTDPATGDASPAPYAIAGFFYAHPELVVTHSEPQEIGERPMGHAVVRVRAAAPRCGSRHCVVLTVDGRTSLRLTTTRAVDAYFGTAYGEPLVVLVESSDSSVASARVAARPVLRQLSWRTTPE